MGPWSLRIPVFIIFFVVLVLFVVIPFILIVVFFVWCFSNLDIRSYQLIGAVRVEGFWTHSQHAQWYAVSSCSGT